MIYVCSACREYESALGIHYDSSRTSKRVPHNSLALNW